MRKHLELFRKDRDGKFRLILVESRIHRLARYYKARAAALGLPLEPALGCMSRMRGEESNDCHMHCGWRKWGA